MMTLKNRYFLFIGSILLVVLVQVVFYAKLSIHHNHVISEPEQLGAFKSRVKSNRKDSSSEKCFSWDEDSDDCWTHHPDFEVTHEDDKSFCLSRIQDQEKAEFYRNVYNLQWKHTKDLACKDAIHANQTNAGFAASVNQIVYGFWAAWNEGLPFQITKHREQFKWMFAPKDCESNDMNCYFLPLSDCPAIVGTEQKYKATKPNGKKDNKLFKWLRLYATRPKQYVRKRVYDFITKDQKLQPPPWNTNCTAMHVRRGDSGFVKFPWRRYAAVQEYIDKGQIQEGDTIFLLTDDVSTIEEVEKYHATRYNWIYLKRKRFRGTEGGFSNHIASGDEFLEVVTIMAEVKLASQCNKLVAGHSGFVTTITDAMEAMGTKFKKYTVQTRVKESDVKKDRNRDAKDRVNDMWQEIEAIHKNS